MPRIMPGVGRRSTRCPCTPSGRLWPCSSTTSASTPARGRPTKPGRAAVGLELPTLAARLDAEDPAGARPWFAIGGVDADRLPEVRAAGAERIVVVRAVTQAEDPEAAARTLRAGLPG